MDEYMDADDFPSPPPSILGTQETPISRHQFASNNVVGGGYKRPHHSSDEPDDSDPGYYDKLYEGFTIRPQHFPQRLPEEFECRKDQIDVNPPVFKNVLAKWKNAEKERANSNDPHPRYEKENGFKASNQFRNFLLPSEKGQEKRQNFGESSGENHSTFKKPRLPASKALPSSHHWTPDSRSSNLRPATQHRDHELRPSISDDGHPNYATYTTSFASIPTPNLALRVSSQRREAYNPNMMRNVFPPSSSLASFQQHGHALRRLNLDDSLVSFETTNRYIPESDFERCHSRLRAKLTNETNRLHEAKETVTYWHKKEKKNYSWNEICAHALLLISELRITTYKELISRVHTFQQMTLGPPPLSMTVRSTFTIFNMDILLGRSYYLNNANTNTDYVFIVVGSTNEKVIATQLFQLSDTGRLKSRSIHIDEKIVFKNLPLDFQIDFCIYLMKLTPREKATKNVAKKAISLLSKITPHSTNLNASIGSKKEEDVTTSFHPAGRFTLHRPSVGQFPVNLDHPIYPFDGTVEINTKVSPLPSELSIEVKGVWKMFAENDDIEPVDFFVIMKDGIISFFTIPEAGGPLEAPKFIVDCSTICDEELVPFTHDPEEQLFTFGINIVTVARGEHHQDHKKMLIGIENEDNFNHWLRTLNIILEVIRGDG